MINVKIKNFQSIGSVDFNIDGLTVIVGKNNLGKSALIRAINAALTNQIGKEFIRHGKKSCEVTLKKDDLQIAWTKGDSASYKINGKDYSRLNRNIPEPILNAGFRKIEVGDQKLDPLYADQFNPLFLINEPGSLITEALSIIYRLNILSIADEMCQKELRSNKSMLKNRSEDLEQLSERIGQFTDIDPIKEKLTDLFSLRSKYEKAKDLISQIELYGNKLGLLSKRVKIFSVITSVKNLEYSSLVEKIDGLNWVNSRLEKMKVSVQMVKMLKGIHEINIPSYQGAEQKVEKYSQICSYHEKVNQLAKSLKKKMAISEILSSLEKSSLTLVDRIQRNITGLNEIDSHRCRIIQTQNSIVQNADDLEKIKIDHNKILSDLAGYKSCPACGAVL